MGNDNYTIKGVRVGGRINTYGAVQKPPKHVDTDESIRETQQQPPQQGGGGYEHPPGAFSLAYSFVPYRRPPPPPYQYQYPSPYSQYQYQYPPSPPPWQQYGGYGGAPPQMPYYGGYGYHGQGYGHGQFPPPNQGGYYNYGGAAATGAPPVYGHGQQDTVNDQLGHEHNYGGAHTTKGLPASGAAPIAGAAVNGGTHGQDFAVHKPEDHDLSHGRVAAAAAATATAVCGHA